MRILLCFFLCLTISLPAHAAKNKKQVQKKAPQIVTLGMVTGPETGTYIAIGRDIAKIMKNSDVKIEVKKSDGSIENIKRIQSKENAALGIVQSDVLGFLKRSKSPETTKIASNLRMVLPLYKEEVHVLTRKDITRFSDLQSKRVVIGEEGSGNMLTAVNLLALMNVRVSETLKLDPPEGVLALLDNKADAVIFVGGKPVRLFKNVGDLENPKNSKFTHLLENLHFVALDDAKMLEEYEPSEITPKDYSFINENVPTIAVRAALVSYDFSGKGSDKNKRCLAIGKVAARVKSNIDKLKKNGHPKWSDIDFKRNLNLWKHDSCKE